jgi:hypothetical protein
MARNRAAVGDERRIPVGLMLSIVVVAVIVVLGLAVGLTGGSKPTAQPTTSSDGGAGQTPGSGQAAPGCAPSDTDQQVPTLAPTDVTWSIVNTVALPASASAGPLHTDGLVADCYAHTPKGALLAAVNLFYRAAVEAPQTTVVERQAVPGPGTTTLEQQLRTVTEPIAPGEIAQLAGFRIVSYTPDTTVVTLVNGTAQANTLKAQDVTVRWSGNDWKLVVGPDGSISTPGTSITSLAGYIGFGGV